MYVCRNVSFRLQTVDYRLVGEGGYNRAEMYHVSKLKASTRFALHESGSPERCTVNYLLLVERRFLEGGRTVDSLQSGPARRSAPFLDTIITVRRECSRKGVKFFIHTTGRALSNGLPADFRAGPIISGAAEINSQLVEQRGSMPIFRVVALNVRKFWCLN